MYGKNKPCCPVTNSGGFTLVELVAVMVIIAALGAMAIPRFAHNDATVPAQADLLGRAIRHAQAMAMSQGRALTLDIQSATRYAITDGASTTPLAGTSSEGQLYTLLNGVTLSGADLEFDSLGRPLNGAVLANVAQTWTLTGTGGNMAIVSIQPLTGFVSVTP
ncbi:MAG: type II secretion system protein [Gammaproteobacteria bacterium]|nr:MAG: type II secretion system protein [Gammaproteobacteria bacterium]